MQRVFILGSGASKCAGIPTVKDALNVMIAERKAALELNKDNKSIFFNKYSDALKTMEVEYNDIKCQSPNINIEDLIKKLTLLNDSDKLKQIRLIAYWYFWDRVHNIGPTRYHFLLVKNLKPDDVIISFNYDILFEKAFEEPIPDNQKYAGKIFTYNPNDRKTIKHLILKPMGSINWIYGLEGTEIVNYRVRAELASDLLLSDNTKKLYMLGYQEIINKEIYPAMFWFDTTVNELYGNPSFFKSVYNKTNQVLKNADEIISLGYSFPSTDLEVMDRIFKNCNNKVIKVITNGDENVSINLNKLNINADISENKFTFEQWILNKYCNASH